MEHKHPKVNLKNWGALKFTNYQYFVILLEKKGVFVPRPSALGPYPRPSAPRLSAPILLVLGPKILQN